jgi:hypothetical protein
MNTPTGDVRWLEGRINHYRVLGEQKLVEYFESALRYVVLINVVIEKGERL